jgi:hypothetical protein
MLHHPRAYVYYKVVNKKLETRYITLHKITYVLETLLETVPIICNEVIFVYYELIKREIKPISECRCDERLKSKTEESTRLTYTG